MLMLISNDPTIMSNNFRLNISFCGWIIHSSYISDFLQVAAWCEPGGQIVYNQWQQMQRLIRWTVCWIFSLSRGLERSGCSQPWTWEIISNWTGREGSESPSFPFSYYSYHHRQDCQTLPNYNRCSTVWQLLGCVWMFPVDFVNLIQTPYDNLRKAVSSINTKAVNIRLKQSQKKRLHLYFQHINSHVGVT